MHRWKIKIFALALLLSASVLSANLHAQQERSVAGNSAAEQPPKVGLRVTEVLSGSPAEQAGLQPMDVLSRYGQYEIVDAASYFTAREEFEKSPESKVEIVYWRSRERLTTWIKPGRLGINFNEYSAAAYQLDSLMQRLTAMIELPDYFVESQLASGAMQPREKVVAEILGAIERADMNGSLTAAQLLVARINAIPDDAPAAEIEKQSGLLKQLVTNHPRGFTDYLGDEIFFKHKRNRAAVVCFERSLEAEPENAGRRLNLGIAYGRLRMFEKADAAADYGLKQSLTPHGYGVAFQVKAIAALGRRDFAQALTFAEKAFQANPGSTFLMLLWQFAAAQTGDLATFYQVVAATEKALPKQSAEFRPRTAALEAYVLARNNETEKARALVAKWGESEQLNSIAKTWRQLPSGEDILKVLTQLDGQK
jgi:tetratricopeptide (TPR) repeat protein